MEDRVSSIKKVAWISELTKASWYDAVGDDLLKVLLPDIYLNHILFVSVF